MKREHRQVEKGICRMCITIDNVYSVYYNGVNNPRIDKKKPRHYN